jgi:uncharacterized protein YecE (DUF72 family)
MPVARPARTEVKDWKQQWRERREARRAKQRAANIGRARKMHLARLAGVVDASETPSTPKVASGLHVGCSGWYYWHWKGLCYPEDAPRSEWFRHYAAKFDTVELNAPFYSWPTLATVRTWLKQAGRKKFVYTVKVPELITHVKRFEGTKTLVRDFGLVADLLGPRMGCFLFQLPPSFHFTATRLRRIVEQLEPYRRNVVEFRHRSWWNESVFAAFRAAGIIFCSLSGPRLPDQLVKTADDVYIRFHGTKQWYRHDYTADELSAWATRIRESGAQRVWSYFNNDRGGFALKNARLLKRLLKDWRPMPATESPIT